MRLLVATDQWFPDFAGGAARVATETAQRLAKRGHDVTVLAPSQNGRAKRTQDGSLTLLRMLPRGVVPQTFSDPFHAYLQAHKLRTKSFDAMLAHQTTLASGLTVGRDRPPLILVYHASVPREMRFVRSRAPTVRKQVSTTLLLPSVDALDARAVKGAAAILILSEFTRSLLRDDHPRVAEAAIRVPGAVDVGFFTPGDGPHETRKQLGIDVTTPLLFSARRLEPRMGLEDLLRATSAIAAENAINCVIAGSGSLESSLKQLARELGLAERVRFVGRVSEERLRDWYRAADVFVLPTAAYEGFGLVTAEALACGTPVVGTPVGATPELLEPLEPRLIATGTGATDLTAAVETAVGLSTPVFRARCRAYAAKRFDWESATDAWEQAIGEAIADPRLSTGENDQVTGTR